MATQKKSEEELRELHKQLSITSSKKVIVFSISRNTKPYGREY